MPDVSDNKYVRWYGVAKLCDQRRALLTYLRILESYYLLRKVRGDRMAGYDYILLLKNEPYETFCRAIEKTAFFDEEYAFFYDVVFRRAIEDRIKIIIEDELPQEVWKPITEHMLIAFLQPKDPEEARGLPTINGYGVIGNHQVIDLIIHNTDNSIIKTALGNNLDVNVIHHDCFYGMPFDENVASMDIPGPFVMERCGFVEWDNYSYWQCDLCGKRYLGLLMPMNSLLDRLSSIRMCL